MYVYQIKTDGGNERLQPYLSLLITYGQLIELVFFF